MTNNLIKRIISVGLSISLFVGTLGGCGFKTSANNNGEAGESIPKIDTTAIADSITEQLQRDNEVINMENNIDYDHFVYEKIFHEFEIAFDTFDAVLKMPDGSEIYGIGYSDFSAYFEPEDGTRGFFPAGFIVAGGESEVLDSEIEKGLEIENLSYIDDNYGFVLAYGSNPFSEHCVLGGKYVQYGVDDRGIIYHIESDYDCNDVDTELGVLYSYDENKNLYDPGVGEYATIDGEAIFNAIDYKDLESEINRVLDEQDANGCTVDVQTTVYFAQEAVSAYLLSLQEETFLGCDVDELIAEVDDLDPMQCIRITPDGNIVVNVDDNIPIESDAVAKWIVGMSCGIVVVGCLCLGLSNPEFKPACRELFNTSVDVFINVVIQNQSIEDIDWRKVAVSTISRTLTAYACPLGDSLLGEISNQTDNVIIKKLASIGYKTISNALIDSATDAAYEYIDGGSGEEVFDTFLTTAAISASYTILSSLLEEGKSLLENKLEKVVDEKWLEIIKDVGPIDIGGETCRPLLSEAEKILRAKSEYESYQSALNEYNSQSSISAEILGGSYKEVRDNSDGRYTQVHETPSFASTGATGSRSSANGPSIKMLIDDHKLTASYGNSLDAQEYRRVQSELINQGKYHEAIQMDIDDLHEKFGDKYDEGISQMLVYAKEIGWY